MNLRRRLGFPSEDALFFRVRMGDTGAVHSISLEDLKAYPESTLGIAASMPGYSGEIVPMKSSHHRMFPFIRAVFQKQSMIHAIDFLPKDAWGGFSCTPEEIQAELDYFQLPFNLRSILKSSATAASLDGRILSQFQALKYRMSKLAASEDCIKQMINAMATDTMPSMVFLFTEDDGEFTAWKGLGASDQ